MKKTFWLLIIIMLSLFFSGCTPSTSPVLPPPEGEEGEGEGESTTGDRVVLVELFNTEGCAASKVINPIMEKLAKEYSPDKVILVELAGWGKHTTSEVQERFNWYMPGDKHTPFIAFNGLSDKFSEGVTGGSGGGGGTTPPNHPPIITSTPNPIALVGEEYTYQVIASDPDGDDLTYSLTEKPEGMSIDSEAGLIIWTPTSIQIGKHDVSLKVSDGEKEAIQDFIITIYSEVYAIAITNQSTNSGILEKKIEYLKREGKIRNSYHLNELSPAVKGITQYAICLVWRSSSDAIGYRIYRRVNDGDYEVIIEGEPEYYDWYYFYDQNVTEGNTYTYYVTAYGSDWETDLSLEVSIDTWLPPCSLVSPADESITTDPTPTFTWNPVELAADDFPYGSIVSGDSDLYVYDKTEEKVVWWPDFTDMITSSVIYNNDGSAASLVSSHEYSWYSWGYGYDENGNLIAMSLSEDWDFTTGDLGLSTVRRALLVGVGNYEYPNINDLSAPPYDVDMMRDTFSHSGDGFTLINELKNQAATKNVILSGIASTFSGADSDDISYFYFTGHGMLYGGVSYLCPTDFNGYTTNSAISVDELASALSTIPGAKVIFIDSCHSGGFIGKELEQKDITDYARKFNESIIDTFMARDFTERDLAEPQYQVLTSCLSSQTCVEILPSAGEPFGLFTAVLCEGCGYDYYSHPYYADANENGEVTLNEAYFYTADLVDWFINYVNWDIDQDTQVYPEGSYFVIIEEYRK